MKRLDDIIAGLGVAAIGIILWAFPMPQWFPFGQNIAAGILIFTGALIIMFGNSKWR